MKDFVNVYYDGQWVESFDNEPEAEEFIMESAHWGAVIEKEYGDSRSLSDIEQAEMALYEVIEK